jgi:hypothetical protein
MLSSNVPTDPPIGHNHVLRWSWPLVALLLVTLLGCPPSRNSLGGGPSSATALLLSVYYPSMQARAITVLIPREEGMECSDPGYGLSDDDPDFLSINFLRGDLYDWLGDYAPPGSSEECEGASYYYYSNLEDQRCLVSVDGFDSQSEAVALSEDSLLHITSFNEARVTGSIRSSNGQTEYFSADNCGERMQYGYTGGGNVPGVGRENQGSPWALRFR